MESIFESLFYEYSIERKIRSEYIKKLEEEIEASNKRLKKRFSKQQKSLLLDIIDAKDSNRGETNLESFTAGFKIGLKIGYEANNS